MVLAKRVGAILRESREAKKLQIRDVARDTNMTPRYIDALEKEDYSPFPGETYTLGFLRNYCEYLGLDSEELIRLYHGQQIDQSQTPIKELTRNGSFNVPTVDRKYFVWGAGAVAAVVIVYLIVLGIVNLVNTDNAIADEVVYCSDREILPITVPQAGAAARLDNLSGENALKFSIGTTVIKFCLDKIEDTDGLRKAVFQARIDDEHNLDIRAGENETVVLKNDIPELKDMGGELRVTPKVLGDVAVRIQLETGEPLAINNNENIQAVTGADIQVTLEFLADSYFEWIDDGNTHAGLTIAAGDTKTLEAKNKLEIKVGNGGGVRIRRAGAPVKIAGPPQRIVKITYRKVPDPLDPGIQKVVETIEVMQ